MELIHLIATSPALYLGSIVVLGLLFGSFFNVVIHRLPRILHAGWTEQCEELLEIQARAPHAELSLTRPGSHCPQCNHAIRALENIPILSFLLQRGRCRHCAARISLRYPAVEALTALMFTLVAWRLGFSYAALAGMILTGLLIPLTFIDIDEQILPDNITIPGIWMGLTANTFGVLADLQSAVIGAVAGYLSLWLVYHGFRLLTGKEGMGYGDFKLLAMLGAWLGWQMLPLIILLSAAVGAVTGVCLLLWKNQTRDTPIPFGPYLCLAGWIALLWGQDIVASYLRIAGLS